MEMTNYERIKNMEQKEMRFFLAETMDCIYCPAKDICYCSGCKCDEAIKQWLESEVQEE